MSNINDPAGKTEKLLMLIADVRRCIYLHLYCCPCCN